MQFEKYDFKEIEENVLALWIKQKTYEAVVEKNKNGKPWYFLQGPPYTSGRLHMGQAWNNSLKDVALRFKRMAGFKVWDRAGYDMHGLPTAHKVQEQLGLKTKEDIENFGIDKFNEACIEFSQKNANMMNEDLKRLGVWMDYDDAYLPIKTEFMEGVWFLVKKANDNGRLYKGKKSLMWCYDCETACAKHEVIYKDVKDDSIFVKLKLKNAQNEYLIIWTTTPWTIPYNLGVMVHPDFDYVKCQVDDEVWIVAKGLAGGVVQHVANRPLQILSEVKGADLEGLHYEHPFEDVLGQKYAELREKSSKLHSVVLSEEYVDLSGGSGLVHMAPGCGPQDWEVGHREGIPPFNNLDQKGYFPDDMSEFSGWHAKKDNGKFIEALRKRDALIEVTQVEHDYAHCERCKHPVLFRATEQWFFKIEDLTKQMLSVHDTTYWNPEEAKRGFTSWLTHLRDNTISKQRYWGTPLPIWECPDCKRYTVIGDTAELKEKCGSCPENIHRPYIDELTVDCPCGSKQKRIPDVMDVWLDAGCVSWICLDYPKREDLMEEYFPVDFILEGKDQIRGWFNVLMQCSFLALGKPSFKNVYMTGFLTDVEGEKMSKSLGNIISPYEIIDKYGADTLRYYCCMTKAAHDMNWSWDEVNLKHKHLHVLWNIHKFLLDLIRVNNIDLSSLSSAEGKYGIEEKYITSLYHSTLKEVTELMNAYRIDEIVNKIEHLFLELSRTYIQFVRDKASQGSEDDKKVVVHCIYNVLLGVLKMGAVLLPFITEQLYQHLREVTELKENSIHLCAWPAFDENEIDTNLEKVVDSAKHIIQGILAGREKVNIGRRWPLKEVVVETKDEHIHKNIVLVAELVKQQTNVKELKVEKDFPLKKVSYKPDFAKLGPVFGDLTPKIIAQLSMSPSETIMHHFDTSGEMNVSVDSQEVVVKPEHFIVSYEVKLPWKETPFKKGMVFVNAERTPELDNEGYAREVIRLVQDARKKAGMVKEERIALSIGAGSLADGIQGFKEEIAAKVGADSISVNDLLEDSFDHTATAKVKDNEFSIGFSKQ